MALIFNPFIVQSPLNLPLQRENSEEILFSALNSGDFAHREHVDLIQHEVFENRSFDTLTTLFRNVTTAVYETISRLYCDPIGRSIQMVHRIIQRMAQKAGVESPTYTAVWAICRYLSRVHQRQAVVKIDTTNSTWYLCVCSDYTTVNNITMTYSPSFVLLIDGSSLQVGGLELAHPGQVEQSAALALYHAINAQRQPAARETAGLIWNIPQSIVGPRPLLDSIRSSCARLGITLDDNDGILPNSIQQRLEMIQATWKTVAPTHVMSEEQWLRFFNTVLYRAYGFSPKRETEMKRTQWRNLLGYNRDPGTLMPSLHGLLPEHPVLIQNSGVSYNDLHYEHLLLPYWSGEAATIRLSPVAESRGWIYLDGEPLCEARARELRRRDGTYRDYRAFSFQP